MYYRNGPPFDADQYLGMMDREAAGTSFQDSYWIAALPILLFLAMLWISAFLHLI